MKNFIRFIGLGIFLVSVSAFAATESGSVSFKIDTPPFYSDATVNYTVYAPGDSSSPAPSSTNYTYVYTLTNKTTTPPAGSINIPLDRLVIGSNGGFSDATSISTGSVDPSSIDTSVSTKVEFQFFSTAISPGSTSSSLIVHSSNGPGNVASTVAFSGFSNDQSIRGSVLPPPPPVAGSGSGSTSTTSGGGASAVVLTPLPTLSTTTMEGVSTTSTASTSVAPVAASALLSPLPTLPTTTMEGVKPVSSVSQSSPAGSNSSLTPLPTVQINGVN